MTPSPFDVVCSRRSNGPNATVRARAPTFAVIGGGPTGVEMAGAIAEMARTSLAGDFRRTDPAQARVLLFEAGPRILSAFPDSLSHYAAGALARLGVEVRTGAGVTAVEVEHLVANGETIVADAIIWCAGVTARPVASWLGRASAKGGAVPVGADCSVPGIPQVFALGDVAAISAGGATLPGLAPVAKQQGRYVANVIRAHLNERPPPGPFRYKDWGTMAVIGRSRAVAIFGKVRLKGGLAWLAWSLVHLMLLVDVRSRLSVYLTWSWAWFTQGRAARLITGDGMRDAP